MKRKIFWSDVVLFGIATSYVVLLIFRLFEVITWSWTKLLLPIWVPALIIGIFLMLIAILRVSTREDIDLPPPKQGPD